MWNLLLAKYFVVLHKFINFLQWNICSYYLIPGKNSKSFPKNFGLNYFELCWEKKFISSRFDIRYVHFWWNFFTLEKFPELGRNFFILGNFLSAAQLYHWSAWRFEAGSGSGSRSTKWMWIHSTALLVGEQWLDSLYKSENSSWSAFTIKIRI